VKKADLDWFIAAARDFYALHDHCVNKARWLKLGVALMRALAKKLGYATAGRTIKVVPGGRAVSGDVVLRADDLHVRFTQTAPVDLGISYYSPGQACGARGARGVDGPNHWLSWDALRDLDAAALEIGKVRQSAGVVGAFMPGTEVGCRYRWPMDNAHPDCWQKPVKGVVLALDDPLAWKATLAFPDVVYPDGPPREKVTAHVLRCLRERLLGDVVPVRYVYPDAVVRVYWDKVASLLPYQEEFKAWEQAGFDRRQLLEES
jgi:hypothetical protein